MNYVINLFNWLTDTVIKLALSPLGYILTLIIVYEAILGILLFIFRRFA